jgi:murein DD-endopeptidase MepM/ murein hydrolase activator NlpD
MDRLAALSEELTEAEMRELAEKEAQLQNQRPTYKDKDGIFWALPVDYRRRSSDYGYRTHPVTGEKEKKHNGVDLTAPTGTPIYATRSGKVTFVGYQEKGAGNYVNIQHDNGYISTYMHMDSYIVKRGDYVVIGQLIGYVGNTGGSTGAHLHFGIKKNGAWVNPAYYLELPYYYKK